LSLRLFSRPDALPTGSLIGGGPFCVAERPMHRRAKPADIDFGGPSLEAHSGDMHLTAGGPLCI
jgi:hypothetical protein